MSRRKKGDPVHGWINLDKPYDMGSTQALGKIRWLLNAQKAGHAGTLDPLATGMLPIALGEATKLIPYIQDADKTYSFTVKWGEQRSTDDLEGEVILASDKRPTQKQIEEILPQFIGKIEQTPPKFSAIKINGQRAYDLARDGEEIELKSRIVHILNLKIDTHNRDETHFICECGKGTYIRSIARDMGQLLGCYGYIKTLRREAVGHFTAENAISLDFLNEIEHKSQTLLPLEAPLDDIPALALKEQEVANIRNGQTLTLTSKPDFDRIKKLGLEKSENVVVLAFYKNQLVALTEIKGPSVKPIRVFNI